MNIINYLFRKGWSDGTCSVRVLIQQFWTYRVIVASQKMFTMTTGLVWRHYDVGMVY